MRFRFRHVMQRDDILFIVIYYRGTHNIQPLRRPFHNNMLVWVIRTVRVGIRVRLKGWGVLEFDENIAVTHLVPACCSGVPNYWCIPAHRSMHIIL